MNKKTVGERIRQLRVINGLSQENVAEEIGMSHGNYGKIERGEIDVSSNNLIQIAKVLKVQVGDFFEEKAKANIKENKPDYGYATRSELNELSQLVKQQTALIEQIREQLSKKETSKKPKNAKSKG